MPDQMLAKKSRAFTQESICMCVCVRFESIGCCFRSLFRVTVLMRLIWRYLSIGKEQTHSRAYTASQCRATSFIRLHPRYSDTNYPRAQAVDQEHNTNCYVFFD